jgi:hypothetical protein
MCTLPSTRHIVSEFKSYLKRLAESDMIQILPKGIFDFTMLQLSLCLTLFLIPFYRVNVCLLFVMKKLPPFDPKKCEMWVK